MPEQDEKLVPSAAAYNPTGSQADSQEFAGLPGSSRNVHFFKTIFQSQLSRALYKGSDIVRTAFLSCLHLDRGIS